MGTYSLNVCCFVLGLLAGGLILYRKNRPFSPIPETIYRQNDKLFFDILKTLRRFDKVGTEQGLFNHLFKRINRLYDLDIVVYTYTSGKVLSFLTARTKINPPKTIDLLNAPKEKPLYKDLTSFQALTKGKPFGYQDISIVPIYREILKNTPFQAAYSFPILVDKKPELIVTFYAREKDYFTPFFVNLFNRIFTEVGQHITQRRLIQHANKALKAYDNRLKQQIKELRHDKEIMKRQRQDQLHMIHELTLARQKSEEAAQTKTAFLANISHELRTPLTAIIGFSEAMQNKLFGPLNATYTTYVGYITTSAHHLLDLINDLLDLTKAEAGHQKPLYKTVSLQPLLQECMDLVPHNQKKITLVKTKSLLTVIADERALKQIFLNLISNAVKFTKKNGVITIRSKLTSTGDLQCIIQDNGIGISKGNQGKLFTPFSQVENVLTRTHTGTGLGLALVKKLCTWQEISVALSSTPNKGTKITLTFPKKHVILSP